MQISGKTPKTLNQREPSNLTALNIENPDLPRTPDQQRRITSDCQKVSGERQLEQLIQHKILNVTFASPK